MELVDDVLMKVIEKIEIPPDKGKREDAEAMKNDDEQSGLILAVNWNYPGYLVCVTCRTLSSSGLMGFWMESRKQ